MTVTGRDVIFGLLSGSSSGVERFLAKEEVAGSNPVSRSISGDVAKW